MNQLLAMGGGSAAMLNGHRIVSITNSGGFALITTAAPHGIASTISITVTGNSVGDYNTTHGVSSWPTATTLITDVGYSSDGTGGAWALA